MPATLDENGLVVPRLPEVIDEIETSEQNLIDPNLSFEADTVLGNLNNIIGSSFNSLYELVQAVYDAFNIDKAEGKNLDDLAALRGVTRIAASKSNTDRQQFVGNNGTLISAGSLFANPINSDRFSNPADVSLDSSSCLSADLEVADVLDNTQYDVTVNGTTYSYTSDGDATASEIVLGLETEIDNDTNATWTASVSGDTLTIASDDLNRINISVITQISVVSVTNEGRIEAVEFGAIIAPPNSVTQIVTVVPGLTSTTNILQLVLGREEETDEELRQRIKSTTDSTCTGTIPSIESAILNNVEGVTSARVVENVTAETDVDGRPPHSYETIVVGGDNTDVAEEIWRTKPAGIQLFGNTNVVIVDSNGNNRSIDFTRPTVVNIAVNVEYTIYDEESFPVNGEDLTRTAVVDYINSLGSDVDVIPGRLFGPIYNSTAGIDELLVEIQVIANSGDAPNPGSWQTTKIAIADDELASTNDIDVYITDVTP